MDPREEYPLFQDCDVSISPNAGRILEELRRAVPSYEHGMVLDSSEASYMVRSAVHQWVQDTLDRLEAIYEGRAEEWEKAALLEELIGDLLFSNYYRRAAGLAFAFFRREGGGGPEWLDRLLRTAEDWGGPPPS